MVLQERLGILQAAPKLKLISPMALFSVSTLRKLKLMAGYQKDEVTIVLKGTGTSFHRPSEPGAPLHQIWCVHNQNAIDDY